MRWAIAMLAGAGATLLAGSVFALFAPQEWLAGAVELGDRRLWLAAAALFAVCSLVARLALARRTSAEAEVAAAAVQGGTHLR